MYLFCYWFLGFSFIKLLQWIKNCDSINYFDNVGKKETSVANLDKTEEENWNLNTLYLKIK